MLMGNDSPYEVIQIGKVHIKIHVGMVRTLTNVRDVSRLRKNLISLSALDGFEYRISAEGGALKVY